MCAASASRNRLVSVIYTVLSCLVEQNNEYKDLSRGRSKTTEPSCRAPRKSRSRFPLPCYSLPLPRRRQVRCACRDEARARDTERPFRSKCSRAAELLQCRADFVLSERSNSPQKKS